MGGGVNFFFFSLLFFFLLVLGEWDTVILISSSAPKYLLHRVGDIGLVNGVDFHVSARCITSVAVVRALLSQQRLLYLIMYYHSHQTILTNNK
jgi:hypothetical protein